MIGWAAVAAVFAYLINRVGRQHARIVRLERQDRLNVRRPTP